jgi:hypothetical protein
LREADEVPGRQQEGDVLPPPRLALRSSKPLEGRPRCGIIAALPHLEWKLLVLPAAILILSVSYFLLKRTGPNH